MPNWCYNNLIITGDEKQIKAFKDKAKNKDTELSFNNFVPLPKELENSISPVKIVPKDKYEKELAKAKAENKKSKISFGLPITEEMSKELIRKYGFNNWYDWKVNNWGTKWDISAGLEEKENGHLVYSFDTAWSPPIEWLQKVSEQYDKLKFNLYYEEPSMCFRGEALAENGQIGDDCEEYNPNEEEE